MKFFRLKMSECVRVSAAAVCALLVCVPAFSQGNVGRILGSVTDQSGGVIAGATVTVLDVQPRHHANLDHRSSGRISSRPACFPAPTQSARRSRVSKPSSGKTSSLEVNQDIRVDLSLQPGEQTQTITVTEELPLIETTNATLGGTLNNETINELPMMGRSYQNLLTLAPGNDDLSRRRWLDHEHQWQPPRGESIHPRWFDQ